MWRRSRVALTLISISVAVLGAACGRHSDAAFQRFLTQGDQYVAEHRPEAGAIEYRNAIKARPDNLEAYLRLAQTQIALGNAADAYRTYSNAAALESTPDDPRALIGAGQILLASGSIPEARTRAEQALQRNPASVDALVLLGSTLAAADQFEEAEAMFRRAAILAPQNELANRAAAAFYMMTDRPDAAEPYFRAAAADPDQRYRSTLALADFYIAAGDDKHARAALTAGPVSPALQNEVDRRLALLADRSAGTENSTTLR
jgi:cytochrome c-type biogenesis protein CcmH/NrfG